MKITLHRIDVQRPEDFERAFSTMVEGRVDAVLMSQDSLLNVSARALADLAARTRLPSSGTRDFAEAGGVIGHGMDFAHNGRRAAHFVDKILKGAKPGDRPIEQPTKFELVIDLRTPKALGLTIPSSLLQRADQVIE